MNGGGGGDGGDKWQDTMAKPKSTNNKDKFEKLKESRQKYKDEADAAKKRCALLEEQIEKLQQPEPSSYSSPSSGAISTNEERELRAQLKVSQEISKRSEEQLASVKASLAKCEATLAEAKKEAKEEAEKLMLRATEAAKAAGETGGAVTDDFMLYLQGAVVGAGFMAIVGYVALSFATKR